MNRILSICLVLVSVFSLNQLYAQEQESGSLNSGTIDSQFEYIYSISNNFQEYKVVKRSNLDKLQANILDSMQTMRAQVSDLNLLIGSQKDSIHSLNGVVATLETEKQEAIAEKDNFTFLGVWILKSVYSSILWIIV